MPFFMLLHLGATAFMFITLVLFYGHKICQMLKLKEPLVEVIIDVIFFIRMFSLWVKVNGLDV